MCNLCIDVIQKIKLEYTECPFKFWTKSIFHLSFQIRGAPAIGVLGSLALAIELHHTSFSSKEELEAFIIKSLEYLKTARPTGVNMADCAIRINALLKHLMKDPESTIDSIKERYVS